MMGSRTLGVHAKDRPALVPASAQESVINVAALMFLSERGPAGVFETRNTQEWAEIFGGYEIGKYGKYEAEGFFLNLSGSAGKLICQRYVPSDATAASQDINNGETVPKVGLSLKAGYKGAEDKGPHGLKILYTIAHSNRNVSALTAPAAEDDLVLHVVSALGFEVGDAILITDGTNEETMKITAKDEAANTLTLATGVVLAAGYPATTSFVKTLNYDLTLYRKNKVGVIEQAEDTWKYLSTEPEVSTYVERIINNTSKGSKHVIADDKGLTVASYKQKLPAIAATPVAFTTGGVAGTAPTSSDWNGLLANFDVWKQIRHMANAESVASSVQVAGEAYCKARGDCIWYSNLPSDESFDGLKLLAVDLCRSNDSYMFNNAQWLKVNDPIGIGLDPTINVPNVGFIMGHVIFRVSKYGYQRVPAGIQEQLLGVLGVVGDQILDDTKRTELADLGVNVIQFVSGSGVCLRNARMASTNVAYKWFNQIFMRIFYKVTFKQSFETLENVEIGEPLLSQIFNAVRSFMLADFNGNSRTGGKPAFLVLQGTKFEDVVTIICDASNNEISDVLNGEVTIDIYFTPPPPAESIEIGVGISLQILAKAA